MKNFVDASGKRDFTPDPSSPRIVPENTRFLPMPPSPRIHPRHNRNKLSCLLGEYGIFRNLNHGFISSHAMCSLYFHTSQTNMLLSPLLTLLIGVVFVGAFFCPPSHPGSCCLAPYRKCVCSRCTPLLCFYCPFHFRAFLLMEINRHTGGDSGGHGW